ncbi:MULTISPECIES: DUF6758 family protein [Streptomyces]|uniref:DUF6758 family protein n=4 Tax=Streptomyces TaxID=1883 RepID=A0ABW6Z310_9ACTN|nr:MULTISPECIES: DUF6758 family protein [Streptomyces]MCZ0209170.1 hypothetical protein [Streptomyces sp. UMAF16]MBK3522617.1 hypothetical protein [Streptomyces sp. MBT70]MCL3996314.1 hypothetical protein [Streptomyces lavenduligriseus]MDN3264978.1 hypothetical protein [Streptomyces sp. CSDS2]QIS73036.1 hypothetical protein HB370_26200 [Streptomyces sp. DSM 40868]
MRGEPSCPRCGGRVRAPGLFADAWQCDVHGTVYPLQPVIPPSVEALNVVVHRTQVPVWMPWPLPVGWLFTGVAYAGDDRSGGRATAVACSGPGPLGGPGELILIAEELGVGLGARYAGIDGPDPGSYMNVEKPPQTKVLAAGRPTPLWHVYRTPDDRAVFAGEALGMWLWAVIWPEQSGLLMYDELVLTDLRDAGAEIDLVPCGALSPRLLRP